MPSYFEFCALSYLERWMCIEQPMHNALLVGNQEEKLSALESAIKYFIIFRSLQTQYDLGKGLSRFAPILEIIEEIEIHYSSSLYVDFVELTRARISQAYGGIDSLSAASKLLWLRFRHPIIIYDRNVRSALNIDSRDYESITISWLSEYRKYQSDIQAVCNNVDRYRRFIKCGPTITKHQISDICNNEWFRHRVFDRYLWHFGAEMNSMASLRILN